MHLPKLISGYYLLFNIVWYLTTHPVCFRRERSQSCPFCRDSLKRVNSEDLWIFTDKCDVVDLATILRENRKRLFMYIDRLPLVVPDPIYVTFDSHVRWGICTGPLYFCVYSKVWFYCNSIHFELWCFFLAMVLFGFRNLEYILVILFFPCFVRWY